jgi:hypothetical protein
VLGCALAFRLQDGLRHLLDEQRNAVSAIDDILPDVRWDELVASDAIDHRGDVALPQTINGDECHIWSPDPGWLEFRPERHE